jgi:hypothetical protein
LTIELYMAVVATVAAAIGALDLVLGLVQREKRG